MLNDIVYAFRTLMLNTLVVTLVLLGVRLGAVLSAPTPVGTATPGG